MDFVILEEGPIKILDENDWNRIIKSKKINDIPMRDLYRSLEFGIPFTMYYIFIIFRRKDVWLLLADI